MGANKILRGRCILSVLLIVLLCFSSLMSQEVYAANIVNGSITVKYGQSEARSALAMINGLRTGGDAWYWNSDNSTKTVCNGLKELSYNYTLEKVAMQRAAEIAAYYGHNRPDGSSCFTAYDEVGLKNVAKAENIAIGFDSASEVFEAWCETNEKYDGQGHRRSMLSSTYNCVGIGFATHNGVSCWVQEFSIVSDMGSPTAAEDGERAVSLKLDLSGYNGTITSSMGDECEVEAGGSMKLPQPVLKAPNPRFPYMLVQVGVDADWTSADPSVAGVEDGVVYGKAAGNTTLTASAAGSKISVNVRVTQSIEGASVVLDKEEYVYDGSEKMPSVSVKLDGKTLTEGSDYTLSYRNNTNAGTAEVTVKGTGVYSNAVSESFTIRKAEQSLSVPAEAGKLAVGESYDLEIAGAKGSLVFSSSDTSVVTVDSSGNLKGIREGSAKIHITAKETGNYKEAETVLNVKVEKIAPANYTGLIPYNGKYIYVTNGVADTSYNGFITYKEGLFLVHNGSVATSRNGLVQDPHHLQDWYFLANGQVQTQYTGLAMYDGEWFYVENGKLNTALAAYVNYDGGLFFVGAGRIMTEVNGLAMDPNGSEWYFLANGQAQIQYTGLALYNGSWFYVRAGKFAQYYTGTVEYNGASFWVVKGEVVQ